MNKDLKEALEMIVRLRAGLQLAHYEKSLSDAEVEEDLKNSAVILAKHGESDDMMDAERDDLGEDE